MRSVFVMEQQPARDAARTAQQNMTRQEVRDMVNKIKADVQQEVQAARAARLNAQAAAQGASQAAVENAGADQQFPQPPTPPTPPQVPEEFWTTTAAQWTPDAVGNQVKQVLGMGGFILFALLVGVPLARAFSRWVDRRGTVVPVPREVTSRLEAIEQAVESIAVEVERISEGQRFTTRLLSERVHEPAPDFAQGARGRDAVAVGASPSTSPLR